MGLFRSVMSIRPVWSIRSSPARRVREIAAAGIAAFAIWALSVPAMAAEPDLRVGDTPQLRAIVPSTRTLPVPRAELVALGRKLFSDTRLSQPQGTSCASCHDPARAFSSFNGGRNGVAQGSVRGRFGQRNPPSLLYARYVPPLYFYQDDDAQVPSPFGGLFLDGRADSLATQVVEPLLARHEMNIGRPSVLAAKLRAAGYGRAFEAAFGTGILSDPKRALRAVGETLEAYLQSDELSPFSSRFDEMLRGKSTLTAQELRGLAIFRNPDQGNCASCHSMNLTSNRPERSLLTDFGYEALAVPRNRKLAANAEAKAFDLGLCKTAAQRHWPEPESWCGYFRTPSLRNVAVRSRFMHNGAIDSLRDAVRFYATRSVRPNDWYPAGRPFDDLPAKLHDNVNKVSTPLNRRPGMSPAINDDDIDALVAFLRTLTDRRYQALIDSQ